MSVLKSVSRPDYLSTQVVLFSALSMFLFLHDLVVAFVRPRNYNWETNFPVKQKTLL